MFAPRRPLQRPLALMVVLALLLSGVFAGSLNRAWAAPDEGVARIKSFLATDPGGNLATWSKDLGSLGAFALPLPLVTSSPGALLGADDVIQKVIADTVAAIDNFEDLTTESFPFTLGDGRTGTLTTNATQVGAGWRVDFTADIDRTVANLDLRLADDTTDVDVSVTAGVTATVKARVKLSIQEDGSSVWLVHDPAQATQTPRFDVDVEAKLNANAKAAVGILGVTLTDSSLTVKHHTAATFNDPNNDGKLAFSGHQAELAAAGSLEGLVQAELDADATSSIAGQFTIGADSSMSIPGFPTSVNATVTVNWPDITSGEPTITATGFDAALAKFQNMSLQDLADGLARVITAITAIQQRTYESEGKPVGNLDLPFMRGTIADAIQIVGPLKDFLADNVWSDGDPARVGTPKFSSLQDLLTKLDSSMDLGNVSWDAANSKFVIPLGFSHTAPSPEPLDKAGEGLSGTGGATFTANTMTVAGAGWEPGELVGRRVVAGTSGGEIAENTATTITLTSDWTPATPAATDNWAISSPEEAIGAVTFADQLQMGGSGIFGANAEASLALIKPSHTASITVVLDLREPVTGAACADPDKAGQACPYETTVAGMTLQVDQWPLPTDRLMLRTGSTIYSANFPITSDIDFLARAGFFKVSLDGDLKVCSSSQPADCSGTATQPMVSMALKQIGDAQHDVRLSALVAQLVSDPGSVLNPAVNIRAQAKASIMVPELEGFVASDAVAFTFDWSDLADPDTIAFTAPDFAKLTSLDFAPDNPKALFNMVITQLQRLVHNIAEAEPGTGSSAYNTKLPGIGRSLRDLVLSDEANGDAGVTYGAKTLVDGTRSSAAQFTQAMVGRAITVGTQVNIVESVSTDGTTLTMAKDWDSKPADGSRYTARAALLDAVDWLVANNPDTIQDLVAQLNTRLAGTPLKVRYLAGTPASIVLDVAWERAYRTDTPMAVNLDALGNLVTVSAVGQAQASVSGAVKVGIVVPLSVADPGFKVMRDSSIAVHANATGSGVLTGSVGGLSLSLGDPSGAPDADKAKVGVDLGVRIGVDGAAANTPVDWADFLGDAGVKLNPTDTAGVSCESGISTKLMACAHLPLFAKGVGATFTDVGAVNVRVPMSQDLTKLVPSGNLPAPDEAKAQLEIPADLGARIADAVLDFSNFEHGLDSYLATAELALRAASFDGKIPVVGDDLQQGADFLGKLRTTLKNDVLGGLASSSPESWVNEVNTRLADKLEAAGFEAITPLVAIECSAYLEPAAAPTLTAEPAPDPVADAVTYEYSIVAYQSTGDTIPGPAATVQQKALSATNTVKIAWTEVTGATGYKVLRKAPGETEFKLVVDAGTDLTYTDQGAASSDYTAEANKPQLVKCAPQDMIGASLAVTVQDEFSAASRPLDIGLPGLSLKADPNSANSTVKASVGYALHIKVGLNRLDGFYVATGDGWAGPGGNLAYPELGLNLKVEMPTKMEAKVAFIGVDVESNEPSTPLFEGKFQIDLRAPGQTTSCFQGDEAICAADPNAKLRLGDMVTATPSSLFATSLTGDVAIDWHITSRIEIDGDDSLLPGIAVDFVLTWGFDNNAVPAMGAPAIAFNDFRIDAGAVFTDILGPILEKVRSITGPIQPIIDAIYAPLPVLSDVSKAAGGGDISLFTLAKTFSTVAGGPDLTMVDRITAVVRLLNSLPTCDTPATCYVTLGSFQVSGPKALNTTLTPDVASDLMQAPSPNANVLSDLNSSSPTASGTFTVTAGNEGNADKAGIKFPIFQQPTKAFALLLGGDVDIVTFDSGKLTLGFSFSQEFGPVYAPPPVLLTLSGSASISAQIRAGMDTYGIRKAVELRDSGSVGDIAVSVLDGLYFATTDDDGKPLPVVTLKGEIAAGAMVSVVVVSVGVEGGLGLTVGLYWNDPNNDGKFRLLEFVNALLINPLCLFQASGRVYLFLQLNIKIGVSIFSVSFSVRLVELTLIDFTVKANCQPPPPNLGGVSGETLYIFAGKLGGDGYRGAPWGAKDAGDPETIKVTQLHFAQTAADIDGTDPGYDGVKVQMLGITREFHNPGIKRVVVDGTGGEVAMQLSFSGDGQRQTDVDGESQTTAFDREVVVMGTPFADKITTGNGPARVDGGGGDDVITTGDTGKSVGGVVSNAWVAGGAGTDTITVGDGDNLVAGDAGLGFTMNTAAIATAKANDAEKDPPDIPAGAVIAFASAKDPTTQTEVAPVGNDVIRVGLGKNTVRGNGGDDTMSVATNTAALSSKGNTLIGDAGSDRINGGAGNDVIHTGPTAAYGVDDEGPDDVAPNGNIVNSGEGNDLVWGSKAVDYLTSGSLATQSTQLVGGGGNDVLVGGLGTDKLYGGPGDDYLSAEPALIGDEDGAHTVEGVTYGPFRAVTALELPPGVTPSTKTLVGGLGNDHVYGGDGAALIYGDTFIAAEQCKAGAPVLSDAVAEATSAATGDGNDLIIGGAGVDTVSAGGGDDRVQAGGGADLVCGQEGNDKLDGQAGADMVWGGTGIDLIWGGLGDDQLFGNDGNDFLYGLDGVDIIEGNAGDDWASGGTGDDLVIGGTRAVGRADGADQLFGDEGVDRLIGDNATATTPSVPVDLATTDQPSTLGGTDILWGGDGDDTGFGGLDDDTLYGNAGADHLEGNNASDTIYGGDGDDMLVGGSWEQASSGVGRPDAGDVIYGEAGDDLITGDNAILAVVTLADTAPILRNRITSDGRTIVPLDLGDAPTAGTSGADVVHGGDGADVILGQGGHDRLLGNAGPDLIEGWAGSDWIEGNDGDDDLVGGSSWPLSGSGATTVGQHDEADAIFGGGGDDALLGDNGRITRPSAGEPSIAALKRVGSSEGNLVTARWIDWYDLATGGSTMRYGADRLSGGAGVDGIWGQDGDDVISGNGDGDYIEGNGGADTIRGGLAIGAASEKTPGASELADPGWPGAPSVPDQLMGPAADDGQDDIIGGSSRVGFRDGADVIEGNGGDDVVLGDNGSLLRKIEGMPGQLRDAVYTERYPIGVVPADATRARVADKTLGPTTRFCVGTGTTCEPAGAYGNDVIYGDDGADGLWGQDGDDLIYGGDGDDEIYGELGEDRLFGEDGQDAILGDRGGVSTTYLDGARGPAQFTVTLNQPPAETFTGFRRGTLDRRVDLKHDTDGGAFLGSGNSGVMPHPGTTIGGRDRIRGGLGSDVIFSGYGNDLVNGDSGGDRIFGGDGEDVLWGGRGCDPVADAATADCLVNGQFDASARGDNDRFVDLVFGGAGQLDTSKQNVLGSDIIDWAPRGAYASCTTADWPATIGGQTNDPCAWFEMTNTDDADVANNQHHHGTDWLYGGLDRDVLQGDVTANGPNPGDRLMDTTGAYNLFSHCNAAYGGFNDVRVMAPAVRDFLFKVSFAAGAGQTSTDVTTPNTAAYVDLAMVYNSDMKRAAGPAFPTTPGHFDQGACQP